MSGNQITKEKGDCFDFEPEILRSSRNLDLVWFPRDGFTVPCLWSAAPTVLSATRSLPEAERPDPKPLRWFWPVDLTFGAWLARRLNVAAEKRLQLHATEGRNAAIIRNYLEELRAGTWGECERIATAGPVKLPDTIIFETVGFVFHGDCPWDGWEKDVGWAVGQNSASPPDVASPQPTAPRRRTRPKRSDATADLF